MGRYVRCGSRYYTHLLSYVWLDVLDVVSVLPGEFVDCGPYLGIIN